MAEPSSPSPKMLYPWQHDYQAALLELDPEKLPYSTMVSMLWPSSLGISGPCRNKRRGTRGSLKRPMGFRWHPTARPMPAICTRHGNSHSEQWAPPCGVTTRRLEQYGWTMRPYAKPFSAMPPRHDRLRVKL